MSIHKAIEARRDIADLSTDDYVFREAYDNIVIVHQHQNGSHDHPYLDNITAVYGHRPVWRDTHAHILERGAS